MVDIYTPPGTPGNAVNFVLPSSSAPVSTELNFFPQGIPVDYTYDGYVQLNGSPVARQVHVHLRETGELLESTMSDAATGYFSVTTAISGTYYANMLPILGEGYNILVYDEIVLD